MRFARDIPGEIEDIASDIQTSYGEDWWWPGEAQIGTPWIKTVEGFADRVMGAVGLNDKAKGDIGAIFWICIIQIAFAVLPGILSCITNRSAESGDRKSMASGNGSSFFAFLVGLMGVLAIKLDCKELLVATTICALISLLFTALFLIVTVLGIFIAACQDCGDSLKILCVGIFIVVWIVAASILNILLVIKAWPFAFGDDALDDLKNKMN
ncbi:Oidioi.mRNA.OKI2018_I69.chr1.g768.t1.cds [Oikopleura dioica]|uniref:Oidioi.mRNA.OKI2018_I69.chr1.g768.t1.cds n=1 Tax=Oikopleura dioica TaxID=34765 RepID=A0ABN7SV35_OIKDI|nr:Oidioi.mRNA.OKI2018_I69.chr1.g768.t1.cds [Oikopleura dioica]